MPAKVGGARVDERRSGPGKPLLLTQDGGSGLWQGVERHVAWLFARTERGSQGATGASEVWSSAFVSAENAGRRRPHKRARFPRLSGRTGRAGRSYGGVVKRCFTWGWIVERRSDAMLLRRHCSRIAPGRTRSSRRKLRAQESGDRDWVLESAMSVAEVGARHLACNAEVGREAHQGRAG